MDHLKHAEQLHQNSIAIDAHLDLACEIFYKRKDGEREVIKRVYLDDFRAAGFKFIVSSIFVDSEYPGTCLRQALEQIAALNADLRECGGQVRLVTSAAELEEVLSSEQIGILLSFEGLEAIENNADLLQPFYQLGVRGAGLVWSRRNFLADGNTSPTPDQGQLGGLTQFGVEVVRRLDEMGMWLDVSHLNEEGFWDLMKFSKGPIIASHSDCRAVHGTNRNLSDDQIRALAQRGGVIGVNAIKEILGVEKEEERITKICDHIDHLRQVVGVDYIGFGLDLCNNGMDCLRKAGTPETDCDALNSHREAILVTAELLDRGYEEEEVRKIMGLNFLRVFRTVLK